MDDECLLVRANDNNYHLLALGALLYLEPVAVMPGKGKVM